MSWRPPFLNTLHIIIQAAVLRFDDLRPNSRLLRSQSIYLDFDCEQSRSRMGSGQRQTNSECFLGGGPFPNEGDILPQRSGRKRQDALPFSIWGDRYRCDRCSHIVLGVGCGMAHCVIYCTIRCHFACGVSQIVLCIVLSAVVLGGELCLVRDVTLFGCHITWGLFSMCENW